jgi:hypothetical protein
LVRGPDPTGNLRHRDQAQHYRQLAAEADDPAAKQEFLELAAACEDAADKMNDCRQAGRRRSKSQIKPMTIAVR